jgi:transcriptional regulator with XRE-family HTH domain
MPRRPRKYGNRDDAALSVACRSAFTWSQKEMGSQLGVTQSAISHIERESRPLTPIMRNEIHRLIARWGAQTMIDRAAYNCNGQLITDPVEYADHLVGCSKCMAKAWAMRMIPVRA